VFTNWLRLSSERTASIAMEWSGIYMWSIGVITDFRFSRSECKSKLFYKRNYSCSRSFQAKKKSAVFQFRMAMSAVHECWKTN
jgi:hypothetical protein